MLKKKSSKTCPKCKGSGKLYGGSCPTCKGKGTMMVMDTDNDKA